MRIIFTLFVLSRFALAQYDSTMFDLIKTTYERSFDKQIINSYLHSKSPEKIKAAILSISQSEDTSFVSAAIKSDLSEFGDEVCFAVGQLGSCSQSLEFLWDYLKSPFQKKDYSNIFYALGKIGDQKDLEKLINFYHSFIQYDFPYPGISQAILQFHLKGITNHSAKSILELEVGLFPQNPERVVDALFVLTRYNSSEKVINKLNDILSRMINITSESEENIDVSESLKIALQEYALMNYQRLKQFDASENIVMNILNGKDKLLKIELAKTIVYWNKKEDAQKFFSILLELINDENTNTAIQTAISLKNLDSSFVDKHKEFLYSFIINILNDPQKDNILKSELFLSGYRLLGNYKNFSKMISHFSPTIGCEVKSAALNPNRDEAIKNLIKYYEAKELKVRIEALSQMINFLTELKHSNELKSVLFDALSSDFSPLISIAADGTDSVFITDNSVELKNIIKNQISKTKDDPDYLEATLSLINLSEKIDMDFFYLILKTTGSSKLYSVRKFITSKISTMQIGYKELSEFDDIWKFAFKYSEAIISTTKGKITIRFNPKVAPVSVGNFCKLASEHFYNGILFHRVVPGFVIQAGDPTATGWGGPGYDIVSEFSDINFQTGFVGMASAGKDTEGSQFFIMQGGFPHLDGRYTNFAKVIDGMDVVLNITQSDKIISIKLIE